jgi:hypothetical protein
MLKKVIIRLLPHPHVKVVLTIVDPSSPIIHMSPDIQSHGNAPQGEWQEFVKNGQSCIAFLPDRGVSPDDCRGHAGRPPSGTGFGWEASMAR